MAQPILNLGDGVVAGYELPSRFAGPPTAAPDVWFAEAHRLGSAGALTALVLRRVRRAMVPVGV